MTTAPTATELLTAEEFLVRYDAGYELLDGIPQERTTSRKSSMYGVVIALALHNFVERSGAGWLYAADLGLQIFPRRPRHIRRAYVSFISKDRLDEATEPDTGFLRIPPDLLVEVVSPNDLAERLDEKVVEYLSAGVRLVWVVYPESRRAIVHRADGSVAVINEDGELDGEDVLPGFKCPLSRVLPPAPAKATT